MRSRAFLAGALAVLAALPGPRALAEDAPEHERRAAAIAKELEALGFPVDVAKLAFELQDPAGCRDDLARQQGMFFPATYFDGMHFFLRRAFGLPTGASGDALRDAMVDGLLPSYLAYYQADRKALVFLRNKLSDLFGSLVGEALVAHELAHAWRDQTTGLAKAIARGGQSLEQVKVSQCLLEGEAEAVAIAALLARQQRALADFDPATAESGLERLLSGEQASLPYNFGRRFAVARYKAGGWKEVSRMYEARPPSTEQLLHEEKLGKDAPVAVSLPAWPADGAGAADVLHEDVIGEMAIYGFLLAGGVERGIAYTAAAGWDGDLLRVYRTERGETAAMWRLAFDREEDAAQFEKVIVSPKVASHAMRRGRIVDWYAAELVTTTGAIEAALRADAPAIAADPGDAATTAAVEDGWRRSQAKGPAVEGDSWVLAEHGLKIPIPKGWAQREINGVKILVGSVAGGFADNMTVLKLPSAGAKSVEDLETQNRAGFAQMPTMQLDEMSRVEISGREALRIRYHGVMRGAAFPLRLLALVYLQGSDAQVVITATVRDDRWEREGKRVEAAFAGIELAGAEKTPDAAQPAAPGAPAPGPAPDPQPAAPPGGK